MSAQPNPALRIAASPLLVHRVTNQRRRHRLVAQQLRAGQSARPERIRNENREGRKPILRKFLPQKLQSAPHPAIPPSCFMASATRPGGPIRGFPSCAARVVHSVRACFDAKLTRQEREPDGVASHGEVWSPLEDDAWVPRPPPHDSAPRLRTFGRIPRERMR
jgi:hypothetical protein